MEETVKLTAAQARERVSELEIKLNNIEQGGHCRMCNTFKPEEKFYQDTDAMTRSSLSPICKDCAKKIALRVDINGEEHEPTKESVILALKYLNKPFLYNLWNASIQEAENCLSGKVRTTPWSTYIKNVQMKNYIGMTYFDSDFFKEKVFYDDEREMQDEYTLNQMSRSDVSEFEKNKADVKRLFGYDPFEYEALSDQPLLYSQLIGLIDAGGDENDDMYRNASCVSIVRNFLQSAKIDNTIVDLMSDIQNTKENSAAIKSLQESKHKIFTVTKDLAAESCISLKNNKNAKKGENTWSGKIKKIKDLNLREGEVNGFDIATCKAMQQVQEISDASIMKQLALDESDWSDMVAEMRSINVELRRERDAYQEINRIILRENLDLKDLLKENDLLKEDNYINLKDLYSVFADNNTGEIIEAEVVEDIEVGDGSE